MLASAGDTPKALEDLEARYATKRAKDYKYSGCSATADMKLTG